MIRCLQNSKCKRCVSANTTCMFQDKDVKKAKAIVVGVILSLLLALATSFILKRSQAEEIVLTKDNSTSLVGEVNYKSTTQVMNDIQKSDPNKPFYLYIYSPGGDIITTLPLLHVIKHSQNVICVIEMGISMAFSISEACSVRLVLDSSIMMQHQAGGEAKGRASDIKTDYNMMVMLMKILNKLDAERLHINIDKFKALIHDEWWMIGAQSILKNNAADRVVTVTCDEDLNKLGLCPIGRFND